MLAEDSDSFIVRNRNRVPHTLQELCKLSFIFEVDGSSVAAGYGAIRGTGADVVCVQRVEIFLDHDAIALVIHLRAESY